jgi:hypothetical protein
LNKNRVTPFGSVSDLQLALAILELAKGHGRVTNGQVVEVTGNDSLSI